MFSDMTRTFSLASKRSGVAFISRGACTVMLLASAGLADAATFLVSTLDDSGSGSLREAIESANAGSGADLITFGVSGTIVLASTLPAVTDPAGLVIDGSGGNITISGNNAVQVMVVDAGGKAELKRLTIAEGSRSQNASVAGILNAGDLSIRNTELLDNKGISAGAIENQGVLTIEGSTLARNLALGPGGIFNTGTLNIANSRLLGNGGSTGAIYNSPSGILSILDSTLAANNGAQGTAGIDNHGTLAISGSTFSDNVGRYHNNSVGGIVNGESGTAVIGNSTFSHNQPGAIANSGDLTVVNSTVFGNRGNDFLLSVVGGITNSGTLNLANNTLADNTLGDCESDGPVNPAGVNWVKDGTCGFPAAGDPLLGPLADNGGPTQTHALLPGSPAVDAADDAICAALPVDNLDQRGIPRPQGGHCDIGAFELRNPVQSASAAPALIQSRWPSNINNFELVAQEDQQLCHYYRDNQAPGYPWTKTACFGHNITSAPALIQSSFGYPGNFELVVREGSQLCHYYRDNSASGYPWYRTQCFGSHITAAPALIQSRWIGKLKNFEVVVPEGDQLCHYYRDNQAPGYPWTKTACFGHNITSAPALIQSSFGYPGNFEVVAREGERLCHYYRDNAASSDPWYQTGCFSGTVDSAPALIESRWSGRIRNFEVIVQEGQALCHYYRDNSRSSVPWYKSQCFGENIASAPALIQGTFGAPGNFEVVAQELLGSGAGGLRHYYRANSTPGYPWYATDLLAGEN